MWRDAAVLVVLTAISIAHLGYLYGDGDMGAWIPLIRHAMDPNVFRHDWFVTLHEGFNAPFIWMMAQASRLVGLETAFFLLHILERMLLVLGVFFVSRCLNPSRVAATLAAVLALCAYHWHLGGNPFAASTTTPHTLAIVPAVFALGFVLAERPIAAAVAAAVTTYIHALLGVQVALLVLGCIFVFERRSSRSVWMALGAYAVLAAPVLIPIGLGQWQDTQGAALSGRDYIAIAGGIRAPWHYLPSTWPVWRYLIFLTYGFAAALAAVLVRDRLRPGPQRRALFLLGAIFGLCLFGTVFVEWIPSSTVLKLQFFRLMVFVRLFGSVYIASYIATWLGEPTPLATLFGALVIASAVHPYAFAVSITLAAGWRLRRELPALAWPWVRPEVFACLVAATLLLLGDTVLPPGTPTGGGPLRLTALQLEWMAIVGAGLFTWWSFQLARQTQYAPALALGVVALATGLLGARLLPRPLTWHDVPAAAHSRIEVRRYARDDWELLCEWIRRHTPLDAVFLTPPDIEGFRFRAERASVLEFKAFAFEEPHTLEWRDRLFDVTNHFAFARDGDRFEEIHRAYASLSTDQVRVLCQKYGARFVIRERGDTLSLPIRFENAQYALYEFSVNTRGKER